MQSESDRKYSCDIVYEMASTTNGDFEELGSFLLSVDDKLYKVNFWDRTRIGYMECTNDGGSVGGVM